MTEVQIPFAVAPDGTMAAVADVENGLACNCTCPDCRQPMIAVQGPVVAWHFRHATDAIGSKCHNAPETAVHRMAKQILTRTSAIALPKFYKRTCSLGSVISANTEVAMGGMRFDALAQMEKGTLAIEVYVKHRLSADKIRKIVDLGVPLIEIDLSEYPGQLISLDQLTDLVLNTAPRRWLLVSPFLQVRRPGAQMPDLQEWVARYGGYPNIPWDKWDAAINRWKDDKAKERDMNINEFITDGGFIKPDTVASGPIRDFVSDCKPGRFDRPDLYLQGGGILGLNITNLRTLRSAWGPESDHWIGKEVELYLGTLKYNGTDNDSVLVRTISPATPWRDKAAEPHRALPIHKDLDDSIPF